MRPAALFCGLLLLLEASGAVAAPALPAQAGPSKPASEPPTDADLTAHYWDPQPARAFVSGLVQVGALNRLALQGGYGKPHYFWGGADAQILTTTDFAAVYSGLRLELLLANLTVGGRYSWSYGHHWVTPAAVYDDGAIVNVENPLASYASLDASLWGYIPVGPTFGYWEVSEIWVPGKPSNYALFEEYTRFTLDQNTATMLRGGWNLQLFHERLFFGPAADFVATPGRESLLRLGANLAFQFTEHLSFMANFTVPVVSPDAIDWFTQSWGIGRLTYRFATGEPKLRFP